MFIVPSLTTKCLLKQHFYISYIYSNMSLVSIKAKWIFQFCYQGFINFTLMYIVWFWTTLRRYSQLSLSLLPFLFISPLSCSLLWSKVIHSCHGGEILLIIFTSPVISQAISFTNIGHLNPKPLTVWKIKNKTSWTCSCDKVVNYSFVIFQHFR